jgi:hypothetical protein
MSHSSFTNIHTNVLNDTLVVFLLSFDLEQEFSLPHFHSLDEFEDYGATLL